MKEIAGVLRLETRTLVKKFYHINGIHKQVGMEL
jgi:hypothetical protein